jgi:CDP-diacylglycerol--glycerol-3-phosphate 3-phosphatidyltransferase
MILVLASLDSGATGLAGDWGQVAAVILIFIASASDGIDGYLARRYGISRLGKIMDPLADKLLIILIMVMDAGRFELTRVAPWMVACVVTRELIVQTLRVYAAECDRPLHSNFLGKAKTSSQMIAVVAVHLSLALRAFPPVPGTEGAYWDFFMSSDVPFTVAMLYLSVFLTILSGLVYLWQNRKIITEGDQQ